LGKPVSSMIQASIAPLPSITGRVSNRQGQLLYPARVHASNWRVMIRSM
jgi:hypothetical protein